MKKIIREPLFHFLALGALLFLIYGWWNKEKEVQEIKVNDELVAELSAKWESKRDRAPNMHEMSGMIVDYIEQEVMYKQALALNLDHDDEIIKRRLAQKMEFLSDEFADAFQPSEQMLKNYYEANKSNYPKPSIYTFQQVYFKTSHLKEAQKALKSKDPSAFGDPLMLEQYYEAKSASILKRQFGEEFPKLLDSLELNTWSGPIESGLGYHLVYLEKRESNDLLSFDEARLDVLRDYNYKATNEFKKGVLQEYLKSFDLHIQLDNDQLAELVYEKL